MIPAIILAGGLGTRLRSVVSEVPKVLAPVAGRPFLEHLLARLAAAGCDRVVLAVGYMREQIVRRVGHRFDGMCVAYSTEDSPLGTGGAIRQALGLVDAPSTLIANGDTWLEVDYGLLFDRHDATESRLTVATARVDDVARYGSVEIGPDGRITRFAEKGEHRGGEINGGVYVVRRDVFDDFDLPAVFSFEADFLVRRCVELRPMAFRVNGRFIDIGVPDDYMTAQKVLANVS